MKLVNMEISFPPSFPTLRRTLTFQNWYILVLETAERAERKPKRVTGSILPSLGRWKSPLAPFLFRDKGVELYSLMLSSTLS